MPAGASAGGLAIVALTRASGVRVFPSFARRWVAALNTGQECELLMLEGTFSIVYRAVEYFTPVEVRVRGAARVGVRTT